MMLWPEWVVLTAGSSGSALRAVCPPNRYITPDDFRMASEHQLFDLDHRLLGVSHSRNHRIS
jgi:hypothetical protein